MSTSQYDATVLASIENWKTRLLQLDRRNTLLYFPTGRRGVKLKNTSAENLLERLDRSHKKGLAFPTLEALEVQGPFSDPDATLPRPRTRHENLRVNPGDLETDLDPAELQKRLSALRKRNREWQEEQGISILYIAIGFLHWADEDGYSAISPILLAPCDLLRDSPREPFRLVRDESDDPALNVTLQFKLEKAASIALPELGDESVEAYLSRVRELTSRHPRWAVEPTLTLAAFPYSKLAMWQDVDAMAKGGVVHPMVRRLAGDGTAALVARRVREVPSLPQDVESLRGGGLDDLLNLRDQHAVIDADFSQLRAIELARSGANLVIHGPPGTGKSQTIANIVAALLADGKRVLFVSEKTAALDVVKRRLDEVNLGTFCLDLHSERGKKSSVYEQLRAAMEPSAQTDAPRFPVEQLQARQTQLNAFVRALHQIRAPLGLSVYDIHGRIASIGDQPAVPAAIQLAPELDEDRLGRILGAAQRIAARTAEHASYATSPWRAMRRIPRSPRLADLIRDALGGLRQAVHGLAEASRHAAATAGLPPPPTAEDADRLAQQLRHIGEVPATVPPNWLTTAGLQAATPWVDALKTATLQRVALVARSVPFFRETPTQSSQPLLEAALGAVSAASRVLADAERTLATPFTHRAQDWADRWTSEQRDLEALLQRAEALSSLLGLPAGQGTINEVRAAIVIATELLEIGPIPSSWFDASAVESARTKTESARNCFLAWQRAQDELGGKVDLKLLDEVSDSMLRRFRVDHRSLFGRLRLAYRTDRKQLLARLKSPDRLDLHAATTLVEDAVGTRELREAWRQEAKLLPQLLGSHYQDLRTDWAASLDLLTRLESLYRRSPLPSDRIFTLLSNATGYKSLHEVVSAARESLALVETAQAESPVTNPGGRIAAAIHRLMEFASAARQLDLALIKLELVSAPTSLTELHHLLDTALQICAHDEWLDRHRFQLAEQLGFSYGGWSTNFDALNHAVSWTATLHRIIPEPLSAEVREFVLGRQAPIAISERLQLLHNARREFDEACASAEVYFAASATSWMRWSAAPLISLADWCLLLHRSADRAHGWLDYREACHALDAAAGAGIADSVRQVVPNAEAVPGAVLRHAYLSWLEHAYASDPALSELGYASSSLDRIRLEFQTLDQAFVQSSRARVRAACLAAHPSRSGESTRGQLGLLRRELNKRKRQLSVRQLIAQAPTVLGALKPCFMMSPLAVSQFLARTAAIEAAVPFDCVVFDEASQVLPEDSVPAISRGAQLIVVGDRKQLPPSNFFRAGLDDDLDVDEPDPANDDNRLRGVESILDVLIGLGEGIDDVVLQVHYRSRHDSLIRYSNHYFYDDRLLTFPSSRSRQLGHGLRGLFKPLGRFDAGASRTNRVEAEAAVEAVWELMENRPPSETIGVVALSRAQADLIERVLDDRRLRERRFEERFATDRHERFFVKNLENVQGDERDHIILSIGYGPTVGSGAVPNRFGPINAEGGDRRLNVAATRARRSMTVVYSLRSTDIQSASGGARLLRRYLEYLERGEAGLEGTVEIGAPGDAESPFEDAVGRALIDRGYRIQRQVGCANYSIDIAILSEDGQEFDLGIECDGATYHRSPTARDRDRIRERVLRGLGWKIHRVWSSSWITNQSGAMEEIERALATARAGHRLGNFASERIENQTTDPIRTDGGTQLLAAGAMLAIPAERAEEVAFVPYEEADLSVFEVHGEVTEASVNTLAELVVVVVENEGPVHVDVVTSRLRSRYGKSRAGQLIREAIERGIEAALRSQRIAWDNRHGEPAGVFLFVPSSRAPTPRGPRIDGEVVRTIDQISQAEQDVAVEAVVRSLYGASRRDTVVVAARGFGFARVGELVEAKLEAAIERLIRASKVRDLGGTLEIIR